MKVVLILSGGMDSTTALYHYRKHAQAVRALSIDYGQRHKEELRHAFRICEQAGVEHRIAELRSLSPFLQGSSQTDPRVAVPHGHYTAESMKATIVPNRNMLMLAVATAWAISLKYDTVGYAAHAGDHAIYPDCRPAFADAMATVMGLADWHPVHLDRPFIDKSKADICAYGAMLRVPFALTYSCYEGQPDVHCGQCGTCVERREAFQLAGVPDPTVYA